MNYNRILIALLLLATTTRAQKAWPGDITVLLNRVPIPGSSSTCYAGSTRSTDAANGIISIKDNGPGYTGLENQLTGIMRDAMNSTSATPPTGTTAPSADQIEQMKQQAMARAQAAQSGNSQQLAHPTSGSAPASSDVAIMKLVGQAQTAAGHINQLSLELSQKMSKLDKGLEAVKIGPNCPEVQQGGYAGPTCKCLQEHAEDYYTRRVAAMDSYVSQVGALVREYLGKMRAETSIVDDMEAKAKYGDAVSNPAFRQMVVSVQRQSFGAVTSLLSIAGSGWRDGANEYANLINAKSGASVPCGKK